MPKYSKRMEAHWTGSFTSCPVRFLLFHKGPHGLDRLVLSLLYNVGIGAEGKACIVVVRCAEYGSRIYACSMEKRECCAKMQWLVGKKSIGF